jgi:hypothetical protein
MKHKCNRASISDLLLCLIRSKKGACHAEQKQNHRFHAYKSLKLARKTLPSLHANG